MKKYLAICLILLISISAFSQSSEKAKKYLEEVSNNVKSYENISIDFKYSLTNEAENIEQSYKGTVYLKKEQYQLNQVFLMVKNCIPLTAKMKRLL